MSTSYAVPLVSSAPDIVPRAALAHLSRQLAFSRPRSLPICQHQIHHHLLHRRFHLNQLTHVSKTPKSNSHITNKLANVFRLRTMIVATLSLYKYQVFVNTKDLARLGWISPQRGLVFGWCTQWAERLLENFGALPICNFFLRVDENLNLWVFLGLCRSCEHGLSQSVLFNK